MKKIISIFICLELTATNLFAVKIWSGISEPWEKGQGTRENPYLVEKPEHLAFIAEMVDAQITNYGGVYFLQSEDFDLNNITWLPIGDEGFPFQGNYDGGNKYIANPGGGIFGYIENNEIQNVTTTGNMQEESLTYYFSPLIGYGKNVKITHCKNTCSFLYTGYKGRYMGGIIGVIAGNSYISLCSNSGDLRNRSDDIGVYCGGIVGGFERGKIYLDKCSNVGDIFCSNVEESSYSVTGYDAFAGGIVGGGSYLYYKTDTCFLTECSNVGNITATSKENEAYASGLGNKNILANNCYVRGTISGSCVNQKNSCLYLFGLGYSVIAQNCYSVVTLTNQTSSSVKKDPIVQGDGCKNCYYNDDCGVSNQYATAKSIAQLKSATMPILLNGGTNTIWRQDLANINNGFPILAFQEINPKSEILGLANANEGYVKGGGSYSIGSTISLQAVPKEGYAFVGWTDGDTTNPRSILVGEEDASYTALFVQMVYNVIVYQDCQ